MNKSIVRFLFLLGLLGSGIAGLATGQTVEPTQDDTLFYRLKHLPVSNGPACGDDCVNLSSDTDLLLQQLALLLSPQGSFEIDVRSKTLIITDTADRRAFLAQVLTLIDVPSPTPGTPAGAVVTQTVTVHTNYLLPFFMCRGVAGEPGVEPGSALQKEHSWTDKRGYNFSELSRRLLSNDGYLEFRGREKEVVITDTLERIEIIRRVIELCDTPPPKFD